MRYKYNVCHGSATTPLLFYEAGSVHPNEATPIGSYTVPTVTIGDKRCLLKYNRGIFPVTKPCSNLRRMQKGLRAAVCKVIFFAVGEKSILDKRGVANPQTPPLYLPLIIDHIIKLC